MHSSYLTQRERDLEAFLSISVSRQLKAAPEVAGTNIPELLACPWAETEQAPGDKECPQAKNHGGWQSDMETTYTEMEGAEEKCAGC